MKEQRAFVFNRPPGAPEETPYYIHQSEYVEPKSQYTCCDCGEKLDKKSLAEHAAACQGKRETENKAIDFSQLKPGMKVRIKSWDRMVEEYGVDCDGDVNHENFGCHFDKEDGLLSEKIQTISVVNRNFFEVDMYNCNLPYQCIESIIPNQESKKPEGRINFTSSDPIPWTHGNPFKAKVVVRDEVDAPIEINPIYNNVLGLPWTNKTKYNQNLAELIYDKICDYIKKFGERPKIIIVNYALLQVGCSPKDTFQGIQIIESPAEKEVSVY